MSSSLSHTVPPPGLTVTSVTNSQVVYETTANGDATRVIAGYEVFRFGVPMIGEYKNTLTGRTVTISPVVPGARYRITAWALYSGTRRSNTSAVKSAAIGEASELQELVLNIIHYDTVYGSLHTTNHCLLTRAHCYYCILHDHTIFPSNSPFPI